MQDWYPGVRAEALRGHTSVSYYPPMYRSQGWGTISKAVCALIEGHSFRLCILNTMAFWVRRQRTNTNDWELGSSQATERSKLALCIERWQKQQTSLNLDLCLISRKAMQFQRNGKGVREYRKLWGDSCLENSGEMVSIGKGVWDVLEGFACAHFQMEGGWSSSYTIIHNYPEERQGRGDTSKGVPKKSPIRKREQSHHAS